MKSKMLFFLMVLFSAGVISCSNDNEVKKKGDPDIKHEGVKWNISSIDNYSLSDISTSGIISKTGSKANAGSFYFIEGQNKGSFEMDIEGYNKEDFFNFTKDQNGNIEIINIEQAVGATTNQNILIISGNQSSDTEIVLDAVSIMKESSTTGIFTLTATTIKLVKE